MWHNDWGPGVWIVMVLAMLAFWALVVAGVVMLVGAIRGRDATTTDRHPRANDAFRILDERFARGEIEADEYTKRRELLRSR